MERPSTPVSRRGFLRTALAVPAALVLAACRGDRDPVASPGRTEPAPTTTPRPPSTGGPAGTSILPPTPACDDGDDPTPLQTAGPFFTPDSPERASLLEPGIEGTRLVLAGHVLTTGCEPVPGALLDFWQADDAGAYDNVGYRLRGHQHADAEGRYRLETVVPGAYGSRTRHIHVRVQAADGPVLTTQLYFPGEPANASDGIFSPELLIEVSEAGDHLEAAFTYVLEPV